MTQLLRDYLDDRTRDLFDAECERLNLTPSKVLVIVLHEWALLREAAKLAVDEAQRELDEAVAAQRQRRAGK